MLHGNGDHSKLITSAQGEFSTSQAHCSMPLLSYILAHDEPTLTNTAHEHSLDWLFLHAIHTKQGGYEYYQIPTCQVIT